jgi:hypothetical protein
MVRCKGAWKISRTPVIFIIRRCMRVPEWRGNREGWAWLWVRCGYVSLMEGPAMSLLTMRPRPRNRLWGRRLSADWSAVCGVGCVEGARQSMTWAAAIEINGPSPWIYLHRARSNATHRETKIIIRDHHTGPDRKGNDPPKKVCSMWETCVNLMHNTMDDSLAERFQFFHGKTKMEWKYENQAEFGGWKRKQNFLSKSENRTLRLEMDFYRFAEQKWKKLNLFLAEREMNFCLMKMKPF